MTEREERLLAEVRDAFGVVRVVEVGAYRFLEFGDGIEQSCTFTGDPAWLEYDYTRAMLLGALAHLAPRSALFLGLGAGSLTQACLAYLPLEVVEAIELRTAVVQLGRELLGFADDPRLTVRIGDAMELLDDAAPADLIFVDLYTDEGPSAAHLAWAFLERCQARLNPGGWLIVNQWAGRDDKPLGAPLLRGLFHRHYWELPVREGNVVLLVPAALEQPLDAPALRRKVEALGPTLGYDLLPLLEALRPAS